MFSKVAALDYMPANNAVSFLLPRDMSKLETIALFSFSYPKCEKHVQRRSMFAHLSKLAGSPGVSHIHV